MCWFSNLFCAEILSCKLIYMTAGCIMSHHNMIVVRTSTTPQPVSQAVPIQHFSGPVPGVLEAPPPWTTYAQQDADGLLTSLGVRSIVPNPFGTTTGRHMSLRHFLPCNQCAHLFADSWKIQMCPKITIFDGNISINHIQTNTVCFCGKSQFIL